MTWQEPFTEIDLGKLMENALGLVGQDLSEVRSDYPWIDQFVQLADHVGASPELSVGAIKAGLLVLKTIPQLGEELVTKRAAVIFDEDPLVAAAKAMIFSVGGAIGAIEALPELARPMVEAMLPTLLGPPLTAAALLLNEAHNRRQAHDG